MRALSCIGNCRPVHYQRSGLGSRRRGECAECICRLSGLFTDAIDWSVINNLVDAKVVLKNILFVLRRKI